MMLELYSVNKYENKLLISESFDVKEIDMKNENIVIINGIFNKEMVRKIIQPMNDILFIESSSELHLYGGLDCEIKTGFDAANIFIDDRALSKYDCLVLSNYHIGNIYNDLFVGNMFHIQKLRRSKGLKPLKVIIFTHPISNDIWLSNFEHYTVYNCKTNCNGKFYNIETNEDIENINSSLTELIVKIYSGKYEKLKFVPGNRYKVLAFLPTKYDCQRVYKYINSNLISVVGAYSFVYSGLECVSALSDYDSLLVLSSTSNKEFIDRLNTKFHFIVDSGYQSIVLEDPKCRNFIKTIGKINITEYLVRSSYCKNDMVCLQMYSSSFISKLENSNKKVNIECNEEDFLFLQLSLDDWADNFRPSYNHKSMIRTGINLFYSGLVQKRTEKLKNICAFSESETFWSYELSSLGRKCLKLRCFPCMVACSVVRSFTLKCSVSCLTVLCMLQYYKDFFADIFETNFKKRLYLIYNGNNDLEFMLMLYRNYVKQIKEKRNDIKREYRLNHKAIMLSTKCRQNCKKYIEEKLDDCQFIDGEFNKVDEAFVQTYPLQVVKLNPEDGLYYYPVNFSSRFPQNGRGPIDCKGMLLDPHSFAAPRNNDTSDSINSVLTQNLPPYLWYGSIFKNSKDQLVVSCVAPISQELYEEAITVS